ncbi:VOC family protein [Georgenia sp. EYE_87]|uniref:VOC family protein n=1 Tax=Georgenia sp. EYE_87 TaxID=2853448 RepID=UPI002003138F|nr:VOC family protein [Georgenia sp. EYE_87]
MVTASPIENRIGQVFIPVRDIVRSARWYSRLLGLPESDPSHGGTIYDLPTTGETRLALDANRPEFDPAGPPRFFFWTTDMAATVAFLRDLGVTLDSDIEDIGSVRLVQFRDPDNNPLMVCQRSAS